MGKLNLFRKGRGKDYRQTKRAIKKQIRKTGGFTATAGADGKFTISGGTGATGRDQSGSMRRKTARGAAEHMTAGIDNKTPFGGSDSQTWTGGVASKTKRSKDYTGDKGAGSWRGTGTKAGVTTNVESKVNVTGPSVENVRSKITKLEEKNPVSMKSSAFKMKHSPFNQGYGSPLNWNDRSPLNNLKKGDELVPSTKGVYMKESSPLNDKESCKSPMVWHNNKCWTAAAYKKEVSERTTDDDITETTTRTQTDLERGETSEREAEAKSKQKCTAADRKAALAKCTGDNDSKVCSDNPNCCYKCTKAKSAEELEETKKGDVTCNDDEKKVKKEGGGYKCVKDTTEQDKLETKEVKAEGTATVITKVTDCPNGGKEYKLVDGKCIKKAAGGVSDTGKARTKKCRCKGEVTEIPRSQDCPKCEKDPKPIKEKKEKVEKVKDKTCKGNKVWSEEKGRCIKPKKEKGDKKDEDCECVKWDCE